MLTQNAKTFYDFVDQPLASLSPQNVLLIICNIKRDRASGTTSGRNRDGSMILYETLLLTTAA